MRKARALASAVVAVALAACTYDIPNVVSRSGDAGATGDDGASSFGDASTFGPGGDGSSGGGSSGSSGAGDGSGGVADVTGPTNDAPCTSVLCVCNAATDCSTRICAQSQTIGAPLLAAAGGKPFCTRPCCTSADCDPGTVCFASGQGGNYCVSPAWLSRSPPGTAIGGAACNANGQCRSGLCAGGTCADTCCSFADSAQECANGAQCTFAAFPGSGFDTHFAGRCGPAPPATAYDFGVSCLSGSDCKGGLCASDGTTAACTNPCRSPAECPAGAACLFGQQGSDVYLACFPSSGTGGQGAPCGTNAQCIGNWCNAEGSCSNPCVTDAECIAGWHCSPQSDGSYQVLACGP
jgi:hypothetical protein